MGTGSFVEENYEPDIKSLGTTSLGKMKASIICRAVKLRFTPANISNASEEAILGSCCSSVCLGGRLGNRNHREDLKSLLTSVAWPESSLQYSTERHNRV